MSEAKYIAQLMCQVANDALYLDSEVGGKACFPEASLTFFVGRGRKTAQTAKGRNIFTIQFGQQGVEDKLTSLADSVRWLSYREITSRGYFGGEVTPQTLLAHTVCHEYAHFLQRSVGGRKYGSVHNPSFYEQLDMLHKTGKAQKVLDTLRENRMFASLTFRNDGTGQPTPEPVKPRYPREVLREMGAKQITFKLKGKLHTAKITRLNARRVSAANEDFTFLVRYCSIIEAA